MRHYIKYIHLLVYIVTLLLGICFISYEINPILADNENKPISIEPVAFETKAFSLVSNNSISKERVEIASKGIGFFKPNYYEYSTLYFYGNVNLEKGLTEHLPMDSLVFTKNQNGEPTTSYAPPWLYPEHLKLDYGVLYFKVLGIGYDFIKVESNKANGQITYLDKNKGQFLSWPEFLMTVNSVELKEENSQKVYLKPLEHSGTISLEYDFIKPLIVNEEWIYGKFVDEQLNEKGKGWIRWREGNDLLIRYSLFS